GAVRIIRQRRSREEILGLLETKAPLSEQPEEREMPPAQRRPDPPDPPNPSAPPPPASRPPQERVRLAHYGALLTAAAGFVAGLLVGYRRNRDDTGPPACVEWRTQQGRSAMLLQKIAGL